MSDTFSIAIWIGLTFLIAGFVKGVVGIGLPTVAMGALSLVMPPASAAARGARDADGRIDGGRRLPRGEPRGGAGARDEVRLFVE